MNVNVVSKVVCSCRTSSLAEAVAVQIAVPSAVVKQEGADWVLSGDESLKAFVDGESFAAKVIEVGEVLKAAGKLGKLGRAEGGPLMAHQERWIKQELAAGKLSCKDIQREFERQFNRPVSYQTIINKKKLAGG